MENDSKQFTKAQIQRSITSKLREGWDIQYLGATAESLTQASELGIQNRILFNNSEDGIQSAFQGILSELVEYRT